MRLEPNSPEKWINLAVIRENLREIEQVKECYQRALQLAPQNATAHLNLGMLLLATRDEARGWQEYEWRLQGKDHAIPKRVITQPRWDGSALQGRSILIQTEQGLGDTLQFIRFIPLVVGKRGRVILECQEPLVRLLSQVPGISYITPWGGALPEFDCYAPLMSLPAILGTTLATLPCPMPYITWPGKGQKSHSAPSRAEWKKVGLCWSSNVRSKNNLSRLIKLEVLQPLLALTGYEYYSFQTAPPAAEIQALPSETLPTHPGWFRKWTSSLPWIPLWPTWPGP